MTRSLASERLAALGLPEDLAGYDEADAWQVLSGTATDPKVGEAVHDRLAWAAGNFVIDHLRRGSPQFVKRDRMIVRSIGFGLASAWVQPFEDGSHLVLVSKLMQETLISMANICAYFDVTRGMAMLTIRRRKREAQIERLAVRTGAMFRYLLMSQRLTGRTPMPMAALDKRSRSIAANTAVGSVMFTIAHELGHVLLGHTEACVEDYQGSGLITVSQLQELFADRFAFQCLGEIMPEEPEAVMWSSFIALVSRQIVDTGALVRLGKTHPDSLERWVVLEESTAGAQNERGKSVRNALLLCAIAALHRSTSFPVDFWTSLFEDHHLAIERDVTVARLCSWDHLEVTRVEELYPIVSRAATIRGNRLLDELADGHITEALRGLGVSDIDLGRIVDPAMPLPFFEVKSAIDNCPQSLTTEDPLAFSVLGVRLAQGHLSGDKSEHDESDSVDDISQSLTGSPARLLGAAARLATLSRGVEFSLADARRRLSRGS